MHVNTLESIFSKINGEDSDTIDKHRFFKVLNEEGFPLAKEPDVVER